MPDDLIPDLSERVTRLCVCATRETEQIAKRFVWSLLGWVFPAAPTRSMSARTRYMVYSERNDTRHPDMTGHPMRWHECPWCGGTLPYVQIISMPDATAFTQDEDE